MTRKINEVLETYHEVLSKLQQDHAEKDEDDNPKMLDDPDDPNVKRLVFADPEAFAEAYKELLEIETEVDIKKLSVEDLGTIEVAPATLFSIDWLIED